jgi:hypothetical protein
MYPQFKHIMPSRRADMIGGGYAFSQYDGEAFSRIGDYDEMMNDQIMGSPRALAQ